MKILAVHNYYRQPGGEDTAYEREVQLLRHRGHQVITYERSNSETDAMSAPAKAGLAGTTIWSQRTHKDITQLIEREQPDIAHFHNTHFLVSPAAYYACQAAGVPVVQSLDNPRLLCPAASFYRDGHLCEDCLNKTPPWPGVLHACYRGSHSQTAVVAAMLTTHRMLGTWQKQVDAYLVATEFYRNKFIEGGLPAERLHVKPHFVDPDPSARANGPGDYALFIGRLDPEKGVPLLLKAWERLGHIPLKIRGSGQLLSAVLSAASANPSIQLVGRLTEQQLTELIKGARFLVWPSQGYYETFGFVAAEAFACGVPVISSGMGVAKEMVNDGINGLTFAAESADDLATKALWAWEHPHEMVAMGKAARTVYEERYTAQAIYPKLIQIYESVSLAKSEQLRNSKNQLH